MLGRSGGHNSEPPTGSSAHARALRALNNRWIHIILGPIAVDRSAGGSRDDGAAASLKGPPDQPVDHWVFKCRERGFSAPRQREQPVRIITARVRHGNEDRQVPTGLV